MLKNTKIFCIGLNKTGTTSLHRAFGILGYKSVHFKDDNGQNIKDLIKENFDNNIELMTGLEEYDAISDWNHPSTDWLFKKFDEQYPGSKFILTTRKLEDWLASREKHVRRIPNLAELQKLHPNMAWYNIDKIAWKEKYHEHHEDVYQYFKNRTDDLLIFDVTIGDSWEKLCKFLGKDIPDVPFPRANRAVNIKKSS